MAREGTIDIEVLHEFLLIKGYFDPKRALVETFGFTKVQVDSWYSSDRRPKFADSNSLANRLEVSLDYLCRLSVEGYGQLTPSQVAAKASAERFLRAHQNIPAAARAIFEEYALQPGAPRWVSEWRNLYERFFTPSARFGQQQQREVREMLRRQLSTQAQSTRQTPQTPAPPSIP